MLRLRTVNMYLPQPVASYLRSPPAGTQPPALSAVTFPATPSPVDFVHARWKFEYPLSLPGPFVEWYMSRLRFGPRLMAVCAHCRISAQLLEHAQIPELRAVVQVRVPLAAIPGGTGRLSSSGELAARPGVADAVSTNQSLQNSRSLCGSRKTCCLLPAHLTKNPLGASSISSSLDSQLPIRNTCNTLSAQVDSPLAQPHSLIFMPWFACAQPLATKNCRLAWSGLSLLAALAALNA